jgi:hypothetical protein
MIKSRTHELFTVMIMVTSPGDFLPRELRGFQHVACSPQTNREETFMRPSPTLSLSAALLALSCTFALAQGEPTKGSDPNATKATKQQPGETKAAPAAGPAAPAPSGSTQMQAPASPGTAGPQTGTAPDPAGPGGTRAATPGPAGPSSGTTMAPPTPGNAGTQTGNAPDPAGPGATRKQ